MKGALIGSGVWIAVAFFQVPTAMVLGIIIFILAGSVIASIIWHGSRAI